MLCVALVIAVACSQGNVFDLEVGQCFNSPGAADDFEVSDVPIVDCEQPHANEVYALFDLPDGEYPGLSSVQDSAAEGCLERFQGYVGRDYATSSLGIGSVYPTSDSWNTSDREIVCTLTDFAGGLLTGTMRDSGR